MKGSRRALYSALFWVTEWGMMLGDVLFAVWLIQLITQLEVHDSYPFVGLKGWTIIFLLYAAALSREVLRNKLSIQNDD
jgi:hypothetical protein